MVQSVFCTPHHTASAWISTVLSPISSLTEGLGIGMAIFHSVNNGWADSRQSVRHANQHIQLQNHSTTTSHLARDFCLIKRSTTQTGLLFEYYTNRLEFPLQLYFRDPKIFLFFVVHIHLLLIFL
uniref:Uncharacterized protein n=1 Tax=Eutreptiella gymnastica TaxID=73025 RepID=A0A7S1NTT1_9EUGL|mmetsp:Transcript_88155/g.153146  ORF Transcript_88155/g.153146 Transcript_88155/m.153146 type:complete len:125 (+) Transcript_88155:645-1019(+)